MTIDVRPLDGLDDARGVADLVYGAYGLTYHRPFLYEPERLVDMNRAGNIRSWLAWSEGRLIGHLATIRPWFELIGPRISPVLEVGLSVVDPARRNQHVQSTLGLATLVGTLEDNPGLRGFYMKCLTTHTWSQRSARRFNGRAAALFPAGVPAWVRTGAGGPTTTLLIHCAYGEHPTRELYLAAEHARMIPEIFAGMGLRREVRVVRAATPPPDATELLHSFDAPRRQGVVWVRRAGGDVVDAVLHTVGWLREGGMEHVTVLMPLAGRWNAMAALNLEQGGLFCGGVIPDLEGTDTLVLEYVTAAPEDLGAMEVIGEDAERLRKQVLAGWERVRAHAAVPSQALRCAE